MSRYSKPTYLPLNALGENGAIAVPTVSALLLHTVPPKTKMVERHLITLKIMNVGAASVDTTIVVSRPSGKNLPAFSLTGVFTLGSKGNATAGTEFQWLGGEDVEITIQATAADIIVMGWAELA